jgi:photosystem II stability/assembly factor-like uncharacterized protein
MMDDPITLLARANPVPSTVAPAPIEDVLARISDEARSSDRVPTASRTRPWGFLAPAVGIGIALVIATAAVVLIHSPAGRRTPARVGLHTTPSTPPMTGFIPKGGMRGTVRLSGIAFASRNEGVVSFWQCAPCLGTRPRSRAWLATTRDSGRRWTVTSVPYTLQDPVFADAKDGWAFGTSQVARYYVTHDGGASWRPARLTNGQIAYTVPLAVAGRSVWAIGNRCSNNKRCTYTVLRGSAAGSTLTPTGSQPAPDAQTMIVSAGSARTAYATATTNRGHTARSYATHDAGRHWTVITSGCPEGAPMASGDAVLWEACRSDKVAISDDGGKTWHLHRSSAGAIIDLVPTSDRIAWALTNGGSLLRTTNAGRAWHTYRYLAAKLPAREAASPAPLGVLGASSAAIAVDYPTGHSRSQIMVVRALGDKNSESFIKLPPGLR